MKPIPPKTAQKIKISETPPRSHGSRVFTIIYMILHIHLGYLGPFRTVQSGFSHSSMVAQGSGLSVSIHPGDPVT